MTRLSAAALHARPLLLALALATGTAAVPTDVAWAAAGAEATASLVAAPRLDAAAVDRLYAQVVLDDALPALHARLEAVASDALVPAHQRAMALLVKSRLAWQAGSLKYAVRYVDRALVLEPGPDALLLKAVLTDVQGQPVAAADWYRRARTAVPGTAGAEIDLRLAVMAAMRDPDALAAYASGHGPAVANRAAALLALLGRPAAALALKPAGAGTLVELLRTAEWALAAGDTARARDLAWRAFGVAGSTDDRRYALALLVESYRDASDLRGALAFVQGKPARAELTQARVDLLIELGQVEAATRIIEASKDPALRRRLGGTLALGGREGAGEDEYRRLIAAHPDQPQWYAGLAATYLARGDEAQALAIYRGLFAANRGRADVLTEGARQMIAMGLQSQAIALLGSGTADPAAARATHLFLFETHADQGDVDKAAAELETLRRGATDPASLADIAAGYERLGRPGDALAVLEALEARGGPADYDRRVFMAQLAEKAGRRDEALARWRALRQAAGVPARRGYVDRRIVQLATQTGGLDALAAELDARLAADTLRPGEIDLLVATRIAQNRYEAAFAAIARLAARANDVRTLRQVAGLYARVRNYPELDRTLRRLIAIDPSQHDMHVRQLLLVKLRQGQTTTPAQFAELDRLMAQLDREGASPYAFRASIYTMAALAPQAEAQLRKGAAARPADDDVLLQLAGALGRQGRRGEAVALLQYAAGRDRTTPSFAAMIGGVVDVLAAAPPDGSPPGDRIAPDAVLLWAQRMVMERIVATGEDAALLGLLVDIAQARGDGGLQLRGLEASLSTASDQRAAVLRELVAFTGAPADNASAGDTHADPRRKALYGRRLLALGRSFPPDVYADIARGLLARQDVAGAERAFAMIGDLGGLVNVDALKGDVYAAEGRITAALGSYGRALLQDQNNIDLVVKTSIVREQTAQGALARIWYWRTLRAMVLRQPPLRTAAATDEGDLDTRRFYPTLVEGLLLTWPAEAPARAVVLDDLRRLFADALARVDAERPGTLAEHARLAMIVDVGHRIADAAGDGGMARGWDAALDRLFAGDPDHRRAAALRRDLVGGSQIASNAVDGAGGWAIGGLRTQAADTDNPTLQAVLAADAGDMPAVRGIADAALARETADRAAAVRGGGDGPTSVYLPVLFELMERLPPERFRDAVFAPLDAAPIRDDVLFDVLRASYPHYARMQVLAGRPLLTPERLIDLSVTRGNSPLGFTMHGTGAGDATGAWVASLSDDQALALYSGIVARMAQSGQDSGLGTPLVTRLLSRPLDTAQRAILQAALQRDVAQARNAEQPSVGPVLSLLLQLDTLPANRPVLLQAATAAASRYPDAQPVRPFLEAWFAGDKPRAFELLTSFAGDVSAVDDADPYAPLVKRYFPEVRQRQINAFMANQAARPADARHFHDRFVANAQGSVAPDLLAAYYRKLIAVDPASPTYLVGLLSLHTQTQAWGPFAATLRTYVDARPDDRESATMLALAYRLTDRPAEAAAIAAAADVGVDDPDWIARLRARSAAASATGQASLVALFQPVCDAYAARFPSAPLAIAMRGSGGAAVGGAARALRPLLEAAARDAPDLPGILRGLWRRSALVEGDEGPSARAELIRALVALGAGEGGDTTVLARSGIAPEIARYLATMPPVAEGEQLPLYALAAREPAGTAQLGSAVGAVGVAGDGPAPAHAFLLALARADRAPAPVDAATRDALAGQARAMPVMAVAVRIALARVLARAGDMAGSATLLRGALLQLLYPKVPLDMVDDRAAAGTDIVAVLALWPDRAAAATLHADLSRRIATADRGVGVAGTVLPPLSGDRGNGHGGGRDPS